MNTRIVHPRVIWATLAMEAGLALPVLSLPTQGQARPGVLGPLLILLLLPAGYIAVRRYRELRDPSWRMLVGLGLALVARALVAPPPELDPRSVAGWIVGAIVPIGLGLALWWRGSASSVLEMTAGEVKTEFAVLAIGMLGVLALMRPFVLQDPVLLVGAVVLFSVGGVVGNALARQDAADAASVSGSRVLSVGTALVPCVVAALLVGLLRPGLLGTFWELLSRLVELLLTPIGLLLAWLASFLPKPGIPQPLPAPLPPTLEPLPPPANLSDAADQGRLLAMLVLLGLVFVGAVVVLLIVKLMLQHWLQAPPPAEREVEPELQAEATGGAGRDARNVLAALWRWLRGRLLPSGGQARGPAAARGSVAHDAWAAYRAMLEWAAAHGMSRRPSETVHQVQTRLSRYAPEAAADIDVLSATYELERYGAVRPSSDALRRAARALDALRSHHSDSR